MTNAPFRATIAGLSALLASACIAPDSSLDLEEEYEETAGTEAPIIGGAKASAYAMAALIDMYVNGYQASACSGAVIAPRVVLTAGHCIAGVNGWRVTLPYAGQQSQYSTNAATKYQSWGSAVNPNTPDVGVVIFDKPFDLPSYPKIQATKLPNGTKALNIGRINNGYFSNTDLFVSQPLSLSDATNYGFPLDYIASEVIQPGDSGGPVVLPGPAPHTIVAVNSGAGGGTEVLARTDVVASWIEQQIQANGGPGQGGGSDPSGQDPGGQDPGGQDPGGEDPVDCAGTSEKEPNDFAHAQPIKDTICGEIQGLGDEEWSTWHVAGAGVSYTVKVTGGDAQVLMWKRVNGYYYPIANTTPQLIQNTSNGPGPYFIAVWSPSGSKTPYAVTLERSP